MASIFTQWIFSFQEKPPKRKINKNKNKIVGLNHHALLYTTQRFFQFYYFFCCSTSFIFVCYGNFND
ncbi:hypothetical protein JHK87_006207 [Glycine soja]|nr:hypothetical protein JHK87_006207 [Glycine soja]